MRDWPGQRPLDDDFARAARSDALRGAPRFSPVLHERVMAAVGSAPRPSPEPAALAIGPWALACAAGVMIAVGLVPGLIRSHLAAQHSPSEAVAPVIASPRALALSTPSVRATLASWGHRESALEADLGPTQLAGLDHDARLAARYVLDPLSLPLATARGKTFQDDRPGPRD